MDLKTATPADIDTHLLELEWEQVTLAHRRDAAQRLAERTGDLGAAATAQSLSDQMTKVADEIRALNTEFARRGGWTRVYVVPGGHAHRSASCHSLYVDTVTVLAPRDIRRRDLSGATEEEVVAAAGDRACTFCYPSAPVDKPSTIVLESESDKAKARAEREVKHQEREADKAAKAIANPDGTRLKGRIGHVGTESDAQRQYTEIQSELLNIRADVEEMYGSAWRQDMETISDRLLAALAHKRGETMAQARERLAPKVAAKAKRDAREMAATARRLGL